MKGIKMEDKAVENYIEHMNNNYATKEELQDKISKITEYCEQLKVVVYPK